MSSHPGKPTDEQQDSAAEAFYGDDGERPDAMERLSALAELWRAKAGDLRHEYAPNARLQGQAVGLDEAADELALLLNALRAQVGSLEAQLKEETAIVDRVWKALGISTYEQAGGKSIEEHVSALQARLAQQEQLIKKFEAALEGIVNHPHNVYYTEATGGGSYGIGVVDGHRCAAKHAADELATLRSPRPAQPIYQSKNQETHVCSACQKAIEPKLEERGIEGRMCDVCPHCGSARLVRIAEWVGSRPTEESAK